MRARKFVWTSKVCASVCGRRPTMPAKMITLMPLPMPFSLMSSPSHISTSVPATSVARIEIVAAQSSGPKAGRTPERCMNTATPMPWSSASGTVRMRVYWLILLRPYSPSLVRRSSAGIVWLSSVMMIEALMYGFTPSATTDSRARPPPEKRSSRLSSWLLFRTAVSCSWSTPGSGTCARNRNTTSIPSVKRSLLRRSVARKLSRKVSIAFTGLLRSDQDDGPACRLDLRARGRRRGVRVDLELALRLAVAEHLEARARVHQALRLERRRGDLAVHGVALQLRNVERDVRDAALVLEAAKLRQAHVDRHLAAFEPARETRTAPRELALRALARGLALAGGRAAADDAPLLAGPLVRDQCVRLHRCFSSTTTRCFTRRIIPRTVTESSCVTTAPGRPSPRACSVPLAASFSPIALLCCLISIVLMSGRPPARRRTR